MTTQNNSSTVVTKAAPKVGDKIQLKQTQQKRDVYTVRCPHLQNLALMIHVASDCATEKKTTAKQQFIVSHGSQLCENTKIDVHEQLFTTKSSFYDVRSDTERFSILTSYSIMRIGYKKSDKSESGYFGFDCRFDDNGAFVITNYEKECVTTLHIKDGKFIAFEHVSNAGDYKPQSGTIAHNERDQLLVEMTVEV